MPSLAHYDLLNRQDLPPLAGHRFGNSINANVGKASFFCALHMKLLILEALLDKRCCHIDFWPARSHMSKPEEVVGVW